MPGGLPREDVEASIWLVHNAYSVKKIYLFLENNDQYGRKKYFSTVVLLYDERNFIDILKNQLRNVNSYRKVLQTCSKAERPCR